MSEFHFAYYDIVHLIKTGEEVRPYAALCEANDPLAPDSENKPWVVWGVAEDGSRGSGVYCATFEEAWETLGKFARREA